MKSGLLQQRAAIWAVAAIVLTAALFGAFGHAHHDHASQPCAACAATVLLATGLVLAGFVLIPAQARGKFAPIRVQTPRRRLYSAARGQRAPPSA